MDLYLASGSPRRRQLLEQIGIRPRLEPAGVDERWDGREPAEDYVRRLALEKAQTVARRVGQRVPVLGADTAVLLDGRILGKPEGKEHALAMLRALAGRTHTVLSAVALCYAEIRELRLSSNRVRIRPLSQEECLTYWHTGEPRDKAGAYAIQGLAASFVERLEGSPSGVMGLPLFETAQLLASVGFPLPIGCRSTISPRAR